MLHELAERPRFLLIGADGRFGWELRRTAPPPGDVIATAENDSRRRNVAADLLDLADHGELRRVVAEVKPHVILTSGARGVQGRISSLPMAKTFTGRFHGEMPVFRWRNRHVGPVMDPEGDALVYTDYRGRVSRFRRRR